MFIETAVAVFLLGAGTVWFGKVAPLIRANEVLRRDNRRLRDRIERLEREGHRGTPYLSQTEADAVAAAHRMLADAMGEPTLRSVS